MTWVKKRVGKIPWKMCGIILFWLILWELADRIVNNRIVLVGPVTIVESLIELMQKPNFLLTCATSFFRIVLGFVLSFILSFVLAIASYKMKWFRDFLEPVMLLLRAVPMVAFVIMLLIWVGNQMLTIYLSFMIVMPLIYTNTLMGFQRVDPHMLEMARVFKMSRWKKFMYIYRPSFMPFVISSCKISLGMSWKSGIMAEVIGTPKPSIGKEMFAAKSYLKTGDLFAWTVVIIILSAVFEKVFLELIKLCNRPMGRFLGKAE